MARVIDVKPNGNLVVMARQKVKIEEEDQYVVLTGECSKNDIAPNRTITSDKVFDLDVRTENAGSVRDGTKRGWFKGGLDRVKPF
jgi:flagellar L-ring protein precursor FlgH